MLPLLDVKDIRNELLQWLDANTLSSVTQLNRTWHKEVETCDTWHRLALMEMQHYFMKEDTVSMHVRRLRAYYLSPNPAAKQLLLETLNQQYARTACSHIDWKHVCLSIRAYCNVGQHAFTYVTSSGSVRGFYDALPHHEYDTWVLVSRHPKNTGVERPLMWVKFTEGGKRMHCKSVQTEHETSCYTGANQEFNRRNFFVWLTTHVRFSMGEWALDRCHFRAFQDERLFTIDQIEWFLRCQGPCKRIIGPTEPSTNRPIRCLRCARTWSMDVCRHCRIVLAGSEVVGMPPVYHLDPSVNVCAMHGIADCRNE